MDKGKTQHKNSKNVDDDNIGTEDKVQENLNTVTTKNNIIDIDTNTSEGGE